MKSKIKNTIEDTALDQDFFLYNTYSDEQEAQEELDVKYKLDSDGFNLD